MWYRCHSAFQDLGHLLHHATAMPRESVVGVVDVPHILGTPQPLGHSAGTWPSQVKIKKHLCLSDLNELNDGDISLILPEPWRDVGGIHILPPEAGLPTNHKLLLSVSACFTTLFSSDQAAKTNLGKFVGIYFGSYIPSLYSTGLHICAQMWQTF